MPVQFVAGRRPMMARGVTMRRRTYGTFRSRLCNDTFSISGMTKDSTGVALADCTVDLFDATTNVMLQTMVSDANGNYIFQVQPSKTYYVVAYKAGASDVAGTTINTLAGA